MIYPMGVSKLVIYTEFVGGRTKVQSLQNTLLERGEEL